MHVWMQIERHRRKKKFGKSAKEFWSVPEIRFWIAVAGNAFLSQDPSQRKQFPLSAQ